MSYDPVVLSFHDALLRQSDIALLDGPYWLNDRLITFAFEYLDHVVRQKSAGHQTVFVGAEVAHLFKMSKPGDVTVLAQSLALHAVDTLFLPVNDAVSLDSAGGSHWSLLVYVRSGHVFQHFDSSDGLNAEPAREMADNLRSTLDGAGHIQTVEAKCRQQTNGYDCGLHVIVNAFSVVKRSILELGKCDYDDVDFKQLRIKLKCLITSVISNQAHSELL